jgi:DNA replication and repair protein RecF
VQDILSQGQQKLLTYSLKLAQAFLMSEQTNKRSLFLIDDLPAELDKFKQQLVGNILMQAQCQVFITGIHSMDFEYYLQNSTPNLFHVEQGKISQISGSSF